MRKKSDNGQNTTDDKPKKILVPIPKDLEDWRYSQASVTKSMVIAAKIMQKIFGNVDISNVLIEIALSNQEGLSKFFGRGAANQPSQSAQPAASAANSVHMQSVTEQNPTSVKVEAKTQIYADHDSDQDIPQPIQPHPAANIQPEAKTAKTKKVQPSVSASADDQVGAILQSSADDDAPFDRWMKSQNARRNIQEYDEGDDENDEELIEENENFEDMMNESW